MKVGDLSDKADLDDLSDEFREIETDSLVAACEEVRGTADAQVARLGVVDPVEAKATSLAILLTAAGRALGEAMVKDLGWVPSRDEIAVAGAALLPQMVAAAAQAARKAGVKARES